jgi:crotonobetainyl-CoA:carnitine CoA-transferase CaiB-like acyl-CoA transferase
VSGTPGRAGNAHQNIVPYQVFEVAIHPADGVPKTTIPAAGNDSQYVKFCTVANIPELGVKPTVCQKPIA